MLKQNLLLAFLLAVLLTSCGSEESKTPQESLTDKLNEISNELEEASGPSTGWKTLDTDPYFSIDLPGHMKIEPSLNAGASAQYAYIERIGLETKEHYVIVMAEIFDSIPDFDPNDEAYNIEEYGAYASENLGAGLDEFEILTPNPEVETINGLPCLRYSMNGAMGEVKVYYQLGVYKGDRAFYQVLTWTLIEQKMEFQGDMDRMISSFKEKPESI